MILKFYIRLGSAEKNNAIVGFPFEPYIEMFPRIRFLAICWTHFNSRIKISSFFFYFKQPYKLHKAIFYGFETWKISIFSTIISNYFLTDWKKFEGSIQMIAKNRTLKDAGTCHWQCLQRF